MIVSSDRAISGVSGELQSIEAFNAAIGTMGWESEIRQLDLHARPVPFAAGAGEKLALLKVMFPNKAHQRTAPPSDRVTFGIPTAPQSPVRIRNTPVSSESITHFADGMESISEQMFSAYTVSVDTERMKGSVRRLHSDKNLPFSPESRRVESQALGEARQLLSAAIDLVGSGDLASTTRAALFENFEAQLPALISALWFAGETESAEFSAPRRRDVIRRSLTRLRESSAGSCQIEDLCEAGACSQRTLERSYREHFGITPKQYLNRFRLAGVHRALLNPDEKRSIGDLAAHWGFWHLSQFSASYRAMYGELPSTTTRRLRT